MKKSLVQLALNPLFELITIGTRKSDFEFSNHHYLIIGSTNYIPAHFIDGMVDLVVWGHEHQCLLQPELTVNGDKEIFISQPGSSVGKDYIILVFCCKGPKEKTREMKNSISPNFYE